MHIVCVSVVTGVESSFWTIFGGGMQDMLVLDLNNLQLILDLP